MFKLAPLPRTLAAALRDVGDKKLEVRMSAVRDLGRYSADDEPRAAQALVRVLKNDTSPGVRSEAAVALADACARGCGEALLDALEDAHPRVRQMALLALGEVAEPGDTRALQAIEKALDDESPEMRFQALIGFHRVAGDAAMSRVYEKMGDPDSQVRQVALRIAEERHFERELGSLPGELSECARAALGDDALEVRLVAAILLARAGDDAGREVIETALNSRRPPSDPEDEYAAIELAGEREYEGARPGLMRRAWGGLLAKNPFAWQARVALARLGDDRAKREILRGLAAWTRDSRTLAVAAAGRARLEEARTQIAAMRGDERLADPRAVQEALELLEDAASQSAEPLGA